MSKSSLVFDAANGQFSVYTCACQCDGTVEVTRLMLMDAVTLRFYIRGHQPLGVDYAHIGRRYEFQAAQEPLGDEFVNTPPGPQPIVKSPTGEELDALEAIDALAEWDRDATTPILHFKPDFFLDAPYDGDDWPDDGDVE